MATVDPLKAATELALADLRQHQLDEQALVIPAEGAPTDAPATATQVEAAAVPEAPTEATEGAATPATPTSEPSAPTTPAEPSYETIIHDGVEVKLTPAELRELARKGFDYTKKTQTLAEMRKEVELAEQTARAAAQAQVEEERKRIANFLRDKDALRAQLELLEVGNFYSPPAEEGYGQASPALSTGSPALSKEEVARLIKEEQDRFALNLQEQAKTAMGQLEQQQMQKQMTEQIDQAVKAAVEANPLLSSLKDPKKVLFAEVHPWVRDRILADPDKEVGIDAVVERINIIAKEQAQLLETAVQEHAKKLAGAQAQAKIKDAVTHSQTMAAQSGIGPGGTAAVGGPKTTAGMRVGDPRLRAMVVADIQAAEAANR